MITVRNEISPLRTVLLHRPGRELEHLSPHTMEQLLTASRSSISRILQRM